MAAAKKVDEGLFSFVHKGKTYTFEKSLDVVRSPGWLRKNRHRDEMDLTFTILETVAGDDALAAIDDMDFAEFTKLAERLGKDFNDPFL